jgi:ABC-type branched-subunit amino acid transport system ATPase component/ABC-type branched-subunit amino acid transport system permease subunit
VDHLGVALLGLGNGAVFAALALALVLTYRSSGVVNFATGALALHGAYMYAAFRQGQLLVLVPGLPTHVDLGGPMAFVPAALLALLANAVLGGLLYLVVFRPLRDAPQLARAVASLGVLVVIQELMAIRQGTAPVSVAAIFPVNRWQLGSIVILSDRAYLAIAVVGLAVVLGAAYHFSRFGLDTRAVSESQVGAFVSGISPDRIALLNWMISAMVAGAAGILIAPVSPLTPSTYTLFVVPALAAAVVGRFQKLTPTVIAGIGIGMLQAEALSLAGQHHWLPHTGSAELIPLLTILVALAVSGRSLSSRGTLIRHPLGRAPRPRSLVLPLVSGTVLGLVALFVTTGSWRAAVIGTFIAGTIGMSLVIVTGYAGQVSVAQLTLAGIGAFTLTGLVNSWGVPFPLAPLLAALVSAGVGVVIGLPALRVRGVMLGVVTLAFAYAIEAVWFRNTDIVGTSGATISGPRLFGWNLGIGSGNAFPRLSFGLLCLVTFVLVATGVALLRRHPLGSAMLAVRANETSAAGLGVNVVRVKVVSFALASFVAGLGGSLLAYRQGVVTFDSYTALGNLTLLSTAYLAGVTSVYGGVLAGVLASTGIVFTMLDRWAHLGQWFALLAGIGLILTLILNPEGLAAAGHALARWTRRLRTSPIAREGRGAVTSSLATDAADSRSGSLTVSDLSVRYGGVVAIDGVSLRVDAGTVVGLIGPNGAGKTSIIDAVCGFARADGEVMLDGAPLGSMPPHRRVRLGVGRTFQSIELYDDLTVEENVSVAVLGARGEDRHHVVSRSLELAGIEELRDRPAGELSQGERQLVSIARACATRPGVLLLDEPVAGLDTTESARLAERIRRIADAGTAVLLVDHDVATVLAVSDDIYVLDLGHVIAHGPPAAIRTDRHVADAYLGSLHDASAALT